MTYFLTTRQRWVAALGLGCTVMLSPAAQAAEDKTEDEITVRGVFSSDLATPSTAGSRLGLTPLETPASVSILSGADIRGKGDATINAAVTRAVGITSTATVGGAGNGVAARGFTGTSVAYIYDGIRNQGGIGNASFPYDPWTVDRVEVLNGPGSVLYGTGAIGGAINIVPRRPSDKRETTVRLSAGSFTTFREALDSTGPITDRLLYRVDVSQQNSDGYIDNGRSKSTALSGALTFIASDTLKFTLSDDYGYLVPMNYNGLPLVNGVAMKSLRRVNYATSDVDVHFKENSARFNIDWKPSDSFSVRNITSLVTARRLWRQGPTQLNYQPATNTILRGSYGQYEQKQEQWNNQTEALWKHKVLGLDNTLSFGGDYETLYLQRIVRTFAGTSQVSLTDPVAGVYPSVTPTSTGQDMRVERFALFVDDRLQVTPKLSITGGLRYDHSAVNRDDTFSGARTSRTYQPLNWRIGAVYDILPTFTAYGQYSRATDPISNLCCVSVAQMSYAAAKGQQVEAGFKQSLFGDRLAWTLAGYWIRKNNLLVPDPLNTTQLIQVGAQSSRGIEASVALTVAKNWHLEVNGTILGAKYDSFNELVSGVLVSRSGNRPTNVPVQSANLWLNWDANAHIRAQAGLRYVGNRFIDTANAIRTPAYTVVDASVHWALTEKVALDGRVFNLFDTLYATTFVSNGQGGGQWLLGAPRSVELALTARF